MRCWFATFVGLLVALPAAAAEPKQPDWLPRYDFAIRLDEGSEQAHVTQQATWFNRSDKPDEIEWVIGFSLPIGLTRESPNIGVFAYMSVEHAFRKKDDKD